MAPLRGGDDRGTRHQAPKIGARAPAPRSNTSAGPSSPTKAPNETNGPRPHILRSPSLTNTAWDPASPRLEIVGVLRRVRPSVLIEAAMKTRRDYEKSRAHGQLGPDIREVIRAYESENEDDLENGDLEEDDLEDDDLGDDDLGDDDLGDDDLEPSPKPGGQCRACAPPGRGRHPSRASSSDRRAPGKREGSCRVYAARVLRERSS